MTEFKKEKKRKNAEELVESDDVVPKKKKKSKKNKTETKEEFSEAPVEDQEVPITKKKKTKKSKEENLKDEDELCEEAKEETNGDDIDTIDDEDVREMKRQKKEKMAKKREEKKKVKEDSKKAVTPQSDGEGVSTDPVQKCIEDSVNYLRIWRDDRSQWKFQKKRQTWLLKHMYDTKIVSDEDFVTMLKYMEPLQGSSRTLTLHQAEGYATVHDTNATSDSDSDDEDAKKKSKENTGWMSTEQLDRVRQVIQLLS